MYFSSCGKSHRVPARNVSPDLAGRPVDSMIERLRRSDAYDLG